MKLINGRLTIYEVRGWFVIPVTGRWVEDFSRVSRLLFSHVKHEVTYCETATHSVCTVHTALSNLAHPYTETDTQ